MNSRENAVTNNGIAARANAEVEAAVSPAVTIDAREVRGRVVAAVANAGSYASERLRGDQLIMADLGFDSLMVVDLLTDLAKAFPALAVRRNDLVEGDLTVEALTARVVAMLREESESRIADTVEPDADQEEECVVFPLGLRTHAWLDDHRIARVHVVPMAAVLDCCLAALRARCGDSEPWALHDAHLEAGARVTADRGDLTVRIRSNAEGESGERFVTVLQGGTIVYRARARAIRGTLPTLSEPTDGEPGPLTADAFYARHAFHGPRLRGVERRPEVGSAHIAGTVRVPRPGPHVAGAVDAFAIDAALQLAGYWTAARLGRFALPVGCDEFRWLGPTPVAGELHVVATLRATAPEEIAADIDLRSADGSPVAQLRGLRARLLDEAPAPRQAAPTIEPERYRFEDFPEVQALRDRLDGLREQGLPVPYFRVHEGITRDRNG